MADDSADYLSVSPALEGTTTVDGENVVFTPAATPEPGQRYTFTLAAKATAADGTSLNRPAVIDVVAATPLAVTSTQPGDGSQDVGIDTPIIVVFNRPVVPLTGVADQADLPQPLTIEPAVDGAGEWINTSIYSFQPSYGLAGGADYSVTVDGLTALDGASLAEAVVFELLDDNAHRPRRRSHGRPGPAGRRRDRQFQPAHGSRQQRGRLLAVARRERRDRRRRICLGRRRPSA